MDIENLSAILFIIILSLVLWIKRKKLDIHKIVFPFLYVITLKTKLGINLMEKVAKRFPKTTGFFNR